MGITGIDWIMKENTVVRGRMLASLIIIQRINARASFAMAA